MRTYYRPLPQTGPTWPEAAHRLAGGWTWFTDVEVLERSVEPRVVPASGIPPDVLSTLTRPRASIHKLSFDVPRIMGILNVTPDSFSDGGLHFSAPAAVAGAEMMQGADILDIGGESTRPGADTVTDEAESRRVEPVIAALRRSGFEQVISVDTRKSAVAEAALNAGADIVNDVSGLTYDPALAVLCARTETPVCVMHAQGDPATMQQNPQYDDVLLDVYDYLAERISRLQAQGIPRANIIADPGIGFGKTLDHNLALLSRLSLFHGLGVPLLLGASRKRFIGTIAGANDAVARMPGSLAVALAALKHGTQIVRVHDVPETLQAIALWRAVMAGRMHG
ncbi:MAG: dihydropteroate synthase [Pseudomonadota bacterium]